LREPKAGLPPGKDIPPNHFSFSVGKKVKEKEKIQKEISKGRKKKPLTKPLPRSREDD